MTAEPPWASSDAGAITVTASVAKSTRDSMLTAFHRGDYAEVNTLSTAWDQFIRGKAVEDGARGDLEEIKSFRTRAATLSAFHAKVIHVTGTIVSSEGPGRGFADLLHGRQQQTDENRDDRDHHQQLDKRERRTAAMRVQTP